MRKFIFLIIIFISACASQIDKEQETESRLVVESWLAALDNRDSDTIWNLTSSLTKERYTKDSKIKYWLGIRKPMGNLVERDFQMNWKLEVYQGNIPDGTHRDIRYWSVYEKRELAKERLVVTLENGQWKVMEWYVK